MEDIYQEFIWVHKPENQLKMIREISCDEEKLAEYCDEYKEYFPGNELKDLILEKFKENPFVISTDIKMTSGYSVLGIEAIKRSVKIALELQEQWEFEKDEKPIQIQAVSAPDYHVEMVLRSKEEGAEKMEAFFKVLKEELEKYGAKLVVDPIKYQDEKQK